MWKVLHSRWTVVLCVEWTVLQWTLCGRNRTACGQWYLDMNGLCHFEKYVELTAQQVGSFIVGWMGCFTVNSMWMLVHSRWTVILWVECSALQWTVCGRYCRAGGQWYCGLNGVRYSEHYVEGTAQQVDSCAGEWNVLQLTFGGRYCTTGGQ